MIKKKKKKQKPDPGHKKLMLEQLLIWPSEEWLTEGSKVGLNHYDNFCQGQGLAQYSRLPDLGVTL